MNNDPTNQNSPSPNSSSDRFTALATLTKGQIFFPFIREHEEGSALAATGPINSGPLSQTVRHNHEWFRIPNSVFAVGYYKPNHQYSKVYEGYRIVTKAEWENPAFQKELIETHKANRGVPLLEPTFYPAIDMWNVKKPRPDWHLLKNSNFKAFSAKGGLHVREDSSNQEHTLAVATVDDRFLTYCSNSDDNMIEHNNMYSICEIDGNLWVDKLPEPDAKWSCTSSRRAKKNDVCLYVLKTYNPFDNNRSDDNNTSYTKRRKTYAATDAASAAAAAPGGGSRRSRRHKRSNRARKQKKRTRKH